MVRRIACMTERALGNFCVNSRRRLGLRIAHPLSNLSCPGHGIALHLSRCPSNSKSQLLSYSETRSRWSCSLLERLATALALPMETLERLGKE